jgi:hyaluronoglucosaminidase
MTSLYDIGVRSFAILLDDISPTTWNCEADRDRYGPPSRHAAGLAHADLLNAVQRQFIVPRRDVEPLRTLPTEHGDVADSPYKEAVRDNLDPAVVIMWTGADPVAPEIATRQAAAAERVWGRETFLWDNYPANDYDEAVGRVLQAPYTGREPGLPVRGVALNLMPQAYASHIAMITGADRNWNDEGYAPNRSWLTVTGMFGGPVVPELRALADTHFASPLAPDPWAGQAPRLAERLATLRARYTGTAARKHEAVAAFRPYQGMLATLSGPIAENIPELAVDLKPWLDALTLWGQALGRTLDGLDARADGDTTTADAAFAESAALADRAEEIRTIPGVTPQQGPVKVADGVLDAFLRDAPRW